MQVYMVFHVDVMVRGELFSSHDMVYLQYFADAWTQESRQVFRDYGLFPLEWQKGEERGKDMQVVEVEAVIQPAAIQEDPSAPGNRFFYNDLVEVYALDSVVDELHRGYILPVIPQRERYWKDVCRTHQPWGTPRRMRSQVYN